MKFNYIKNIFFYQFSLIIILLVILISSHTFLVAQDAYDESYYEEISDDIISEDTEDTYEEIDSENDEAYTENSEEEIPLEDTEDTYEEIDSENDEAYTEDIEKEVPLEDPNVSVKIQLPLFRNYKLPITVDSNNPQLPANHNLVKLRGTVWRGEEKEIRTNSKGVYAEYRSYIFFDSRSDAIAYAYLPYHLNQTPLDPIRQNYISLIPLIKTNNYIPILAQYNKKEPPSQNLDYIASTNLTRNYEYRQALEQLVQKTNYNMVQPDEKFIKDEVAIYEEDLIQIDKTKKTPKSITIDNMPNGVIIITNKVLNVITNITSIDPSGRLLFKSYNPLDFDSNYMPDQNNSSNIEKFDTLPLPSTLYRSGIQQKSDNMNQDDYYMDFVDPNDLYDIYSDNVFSKLEKLPISMVAQSLVEQGLDPSQYIINIGGQNSGIFVHQIQNSKNPYKVIFLSLDKGMNLYEYNIDNNFDIRDPSLPSTKTVRELYQQILEERINMKKYKQVYLQRNIFD